MRPSALYRLVAVSLVLIGLAGGAAAQQAVIPYTSQTGSPPNAPVSPSNPLAVSDATGNAAIVAAILGGYLTPPLATLNGDTAVYTGSITGPTTGVLTFTAPGPTSGVFDMNGYNGLLIQVTAVGTGVTMRFQNSMDNSTFADVGYVIPQTGGSSAGGTLSISSTGFYFLPRGARYVRLNVSANTSGTTTVYAQQITAPPPFQFVGQGGPGSTGSPWYIQQVANATSSLMSVARIQSAATTNATSVKSSAGNIYGIDLGNNGASDAWFKIYNKAASPTVGTDTPIWTIYIPKGTARFIPIDVPQQLSTGIAYAITGAAADSDTTAVGLNQVTGQVLYK